MNKRTIVWAVFFVRGGNNNVVDRNQHWRRWDSCNSGWCHWFVAEGRSKVGYGLDGRRVHSKDCFTYRVKWRIWGRRCSWFWRGGYWSCRINGRKNLHSICNNYQKRYLIECIDVYYPLKWANWGIYYVTWMDEGELMKSEYLEFVKIYSNFIHFSICLLFSKDLLKWFLRIY